MNRPEEQTPTPFPSYPDRLPEGGWPLRLRIEIEALRSEQRADRSALAEELSVVRHDAREAQRWSSFGSAAGTAVAIALWHLLSVLLERGPQ